MKSRRFPFLLVVAMALPAILLLIACTKGLLATPDGPEAAGVGRSDGVKQSSSAIAITNDGRWVLAVNPDSHSVSLLDTTTDRLAAEIPVGIDPGSVAIAPDDATAAIANRGADSISWVDISAGVVMRDTTVGDRPSGVAYSPDGRFVAVAESGDDTIRFLDAATFSPLSVTAVPDRPRGLAFTPDGRFLLITHLLSGNVTRLSVRPYAQFLPVAGYGASTRQRLRYWDQGHQSAGRDQPSPITEISTWPNVAPAPAVVINATGTRAYLPQTMANGLGLNTGFDTTVFPKVSVLNLETNSHQTSEHISLPETDRPVGLPWAVALAPDDRELWVVHAASDDVSAIDISDPTRPVRSGHVTVGANPRGIVISPDGGRAYVNNVLAGTVSVIDTADHAVTAVITTTNIPLPPILLNGKRLFHNSARPELAQASWISCNTCHIEGEHDGRTWLLQFLGEVLPGATPVITRNTTSLLGMIETYPLRWSAEWDESADSEFSIRFEQFGMGLINGDMHPTLGTPNQGRAYDLDSLAAYIDSLAAPARAHTLTPAEQRGKAIFESAATGCAGCHPAPLYTDLQVHDVGTADAPGEYFGPWIDTPTLRFLYDSAPYLHDGRAADLRQVLTSANPDDEHGFTSHLTEEEIGDLIAYLLALPYSSPGGAHDAP